MIAKVLENEDDFYTFVPSKRIDSLPIHVSVDTLALDTEVQDHLEAELVEYLRSELSQVPTEEFSRSRPANPSEVGTGGLRVSLFGFPLSEAASDRLAKQLHERVLDLLSTSTKKVNNEGVLLYTAATSPCVCAWTGSGPGEEISLDSLLKLTKPLPWTIALYLDDGEDAIRMFVEADATLDRDEMYIALENETNWAKRLVAYSYCGGGAKAYLHQPAGGGRSSSFTIRQGCGLTDTLVFRDQRFLGTWWDVGHFNPNEFWRALGGKRVKFTWLSD